MSRTFTAAVHREEDLYVAECPEVGTVSQGTTIDEAVANLGEATELYLEEFPVPQNGRARLAVSRRLPLRQPEGRGSCLRCVVGGC